MPGWQEPSDRARMSM